MTEKKIYTLNLKLDNDAPETIFNLNTVEEQSAMLASILLGADGEEFDRGKLISAASLICEKILHEKKIDSPECAERLIAEILMSRKITDALSKILRA